MEGRVPMPEVGPGSSTRRVRSFASGSPSVLSDVDINTGSLYISGQNISNMGNI